MPKILTPAKKNQILWIIILLFVYLLMLPPTVSGMSPNTLLGKTNESRTQAGLHTLTISEKLNESAQMKAEDMCEQNYWAHTSPSGQTAWDLMDASGYSYSTAGENLAKGFSNDKEVVNAWLASPSHRDNLLSHNYTEVGLAEMECQADESSYNLIVAHYGKPYQNPLSQLWQRYISVVEVSFTKVNPF